MTDERREVIRNLRQMLDTAIDDSGFRTANSACTEADWRLGSDQIEFAEKAVAAAIALLEKDASPNPPEVVQDAG